LDGDGNLAKTFSDAYYSICLPAPCSLHYDFSALPSHSDCVNNLVARMGTGSGGRKRSRREREKLLAEGLVDNAVAKEAQIRALGTAINPNVPDSALFVEDRAGVNLKDALKPTTSLSKRALRKIPKHRRSEHALAANEENKAARIACPGRKAQRGVAGVDLAILKKRSFPCLADKARLAAMIPRGEEDVWETELAGQVHASKSKIQKSMEARLHAPVRATVSILTPDNGISVNPHNNAHQDALGVAVASQIDLMDRAKWEKDAIMASPAVLLEPDIYVADDISEDDDDGSDGDRSGGNTFTDRSRASFQRFAGGAPERKTRSERNRASRRRQAEALHIRKLARVRQAHQVDKIDELCALAEVEVRKLEGVDAAERRQKAENALLLDPSAAHAMPRVKKLAGVRVPTERDASTVPLSSDLAESLRAVGMPKVNPLLRDRFLSLQRRGFIEPPPAIFKERAQAKKDRLREEQRDKLIRKGRGSRSNLTYWRKARKR
jgi:Nop53 (60S ribosomal biogenesis)